MGSVGRGESPMHRRCTAPAMHRRHRRGKNGSTSSRVAHASAMLRSMTSSTSTPFRRPGDPLTQGRRVREGHGAGLRSWAAGWLHRGRLVAAIGGASDPTPEGTQGTHSSIDGLMGSLRSLGVGSAAPSIAGR
eukprot:3785260-Pyramimonas_sp.AAC.1